MPTIDFTSSRHLTQAVKATVVQTPFILDKFFSQKENATSETIDIPLVATKDQRANFVSKGQDALVVNGDSTTLTTVKVPTTYEQRVFSESDADKFNPTLISYLAQDEQNNLINDAIIAEVERLKKRVVTRRESMACESAFNGILSVSQANVEFSIDYGFVTGQNKITKSGTAKWDGSTADILGDFRTARSLGIKKGYSIDTCVLSTDLATTFMKNVDVLKYLNNNNFRVGSLDMTAKKYSNANLIGIFHGIEVWEYSNEYVDSSGVSQPMFSATKALFGASVNANKLITAPIRRFVNGKLTAVGSGEYMDVETSRDGRQLSWKLEQKSLPTICDRNAFISITAV